VAARVVGELPSRVGAAIGDPGAVRMVFGAVHAGDAANVIPSRAELRTSVRTPSLDVWERLPGIVSEALAELLAATGAGFELDYTHGVPPVVNEEGMTAILRRAAASELGADAVTDAVQSWGGDDFAWYTREVPGTYVRLGVHDPDSGCPRLDLHAGRFDVDERAIAVGVRLGVAAIAAFFDVDGPEED